MKRREEKNVSVLSCVTAGVLGGGTAVLVLLLATFGLAALLLTGRVKEASAGNWCMVLAAVATLVGTRFAAKRAGGRRLVVSLLTAAVVLGLLVLIGRVCFHDSERWSMGRMVLPCVLGALAAAFLGSGKKRHSRR